MIDTAQETINTATEECLVRFAIKDTAQKQVNHSMLETLKLLNTELRKLYGLNEIFLTVLKEQKGRIDKLEERIKTDAN